MTTTSISKPATNSRIRHHPRQKIAHIAKGKGRAPECRTTTTRMQTGVARDVARGCGICFIKEAAKMRHKVFTVITTFDSSNQPIREKVGIGGRRKVESSLVEWSVDTLSGTTISVVARVSTKGVEVFVPESVNLNINRT